MNIYLIRFENYTARSIAWTFADVYALYARFC